MKHFIILMFALIPFISGCEKDNDINAQVREIAWNSLSEHDKATVIIDWQKSPVTETIFQDKSVYAVSFNTSDDPLLGPIIVYIEKSSLIIIGQAPRL